MISIFYGTCTIISVLVLIYMVQKNYTIIDIYYWTLVIIVPIILSGYWLESISESKDAAMTAVCIQYLDSTVMLTLMLFSMLRSISIRVKPAQKILAYAIAFGHIFLVFFCRNNNLYYASYDIIKTPDGTITIDTDGPLKILHYIYLTIMLLSIVSLIIYGFFKKGTYSRRTLALYAVFAAASIILYAVEILFRTECSLLPVIYVIADVAIALNYDHAHSHYIEHLVSEIEENHELRGYVVFDLNKRLLGMNGRASFFIPKLKELIIDEHIPKADKELQDLLYGLIDNIQNGRSTSKKFEIGNMTCNCEVSYFSVRKGGKAGGYIFEFRDITEEQNYINFVEDYNKRLNDEVDVQTKHIREIQESVVLGLANMVENRDYNTGGHIKRTSDTIRILVQEILKENILKIDSQMAEDIIRAAPMHDLGKISIDNAILCKEGKLTEEEYEIMKTHSVKSGEIVKIILGGVEESHFVNTAYKVARFHHERWDGKGYPEGLLKENIPLEARIMAIADVYDALVSKRCYKEPFSFEVAYDIMIENMGSQFDPNLKNVFINCRNQMEEYYRNL